MRHCADARFVWNLGLEQRSFWRRGMKSLSVYDQKRSLTEARQVYEWLRAGSSVVQQQALFDLDRAFRNWWSNPGHFRYPTWRRVGQHEGFYVRDLAVRRLNAKWAEVLVPKVGWVRFRLTRQFAQVEQASSARVTLDRAGRWHISFTTPQPSFKREATGSLAGIDLGIAKSVTTSDGIHLEMPALISPGESQRKRRLQRQLARQQKGSNRRARTRQALARLSAKESDRRKDWIEKTSTQMVRDHDLIVLEDLKVKNMTRSARGTLENPGKNVRQKTGLNRAISGQAWATFRRRLEDKAQAATSPVEVIVVNSAFTSQRCSTCGHTAKENRESQAVFLCQSCGHHEHADVNAAKNILAAGLAVTGRGGTPHAPPQQVEQAQRPEEASTTRDLALV